MYKNHRAGALLLMGGAGSRFGSEIPKQFHLINEKEIYLHTLKKFLSSNFFDEILLVCHPDWIPRVQQKTKAFEKVRVIAGGESRQLSSLLGLKGFSTPPHLVSIHDAVRPFVSLEILRDNLEGALLYGAVNTCIPSSDTLILSYLKKNIDSMLNRELILRGQTPQTFLYQKILSAHLERLKNGPPDASDDCRLILEKEAKVHIVKGSELNFKITSPLDLVIANDLLKRYPSI